MKVTEQTLKIITFWVWSDVWYKGQWFGADNFSRTCSGREESSERTHHFLHATLWSSSLQQCEHHLLSIYFRILNGLNLHVQTRSSTCRSVSFHPLSLFPTLLKVSYPYLYHSWVNRNEGVISWQRLCLVFTSTHSAHQGMGMCWQSFWDLFQVLEANKEPPGRLKQIAILGNSFEGYRDRWGFLQHAQIHGLHLHKHHIIHHVT